MTQLEKPMPIGQLIEDIKTSENKLDVIMQYEHDENIRFKPEEKARLMRWALFFPIEVQMTLVVCATLLTAVIL